MNTNKELFDNSFKSFVVGDALGAPLEFFEDGTYARAEEMLELTNFGYPKGTWTDDTSMVLATLDFFNKSADYTGLMHNFYNFKTHGEYTPFGVCFDLGFGTSKALANFNSGTAPKECGSKMDSNNGNGALMRMQPLAFTMLEELDVLKRFNTVKDYTTLTHGHEKSIMASFLYVELMDYLLRGNSLAESLTMLKTTGKWLVKNVPEYKDSFHLFEKSLNEGLGYKPVGSGYVVDTFNFVLYTLKSSNSYRECMLNAINNSGDNDTIGALTGSLAVLVFDDYEDDLNSWWSEIQSTECLEKYYVPFLLKEGE